MTRFNWDDMQFFLALARDGQLSGAARHLGTSHVTVARRIERLESSLRQRLFERSARGYELTATGRRLVETAERMEQVSETIARGEQTSAGFVGTLRMAVPEGFSSFFSQHLLPDFTRQFPKVSLELITLTQVLSLSRREADISVTLDPIAKGGYKSELLTDYNLRLYASRDYLANHPPIHEKDDLLNHPFLGYIEEMLFASGLDYLREVHPMLRPIFKSSSIFNQMSATRQGLGLCVLPGYIVDHGGDLVSVLSDQITLRRTYWLTCHGDVRQLRRERAVISFLMDSVANLRDRIFLS